MFIPSPTPSPENKIQKKKTLPYSHPLEIMTYNKKKTIIQTEDSHVHNKDEDIP